MEQQSFSSDDYQWMAEALRLAEQGIYSTSPNPRVGCVIVKDGMVIGRGAHLKAGQGHAEVNALREAGERAKGAVAYVTLEPCSHFGRTPPCADALIRAGVKRVVAAMQDPNPQVAGNGLAKLAEAGIEVQSGLLEAQAKALNLGFISRMTRQRPYVRSKIAASLDGRTALANGKSQWITSSEARADVQNWRAQSCAVLTGIGTVLADDPQLTVRDISLSEKMLGRPLVRVVLDSQLRMPLEAKILEHGNTYIAYSADTQNKHAKLEALGAQLLKLPMEAQQGNQVCLKSLFEALASLGINELLVEAGQHLNGALQRAQLIDEYLIYLAPKIMGGDARAMFDMLNLSEMQSVPAFDIIEMRQLGGDIRIRATPSAH